jgi:ABC-2 type transport system permease protein
VSGIGAVVYRDWRQRITNVGFVFWDLFVPIAYLALFGIGFDRAVASSFMVDELLTYPITRRQLLIGKVCFNLLLSAVGALLAVALGVFAMHIQIRWKFLPLTALVIMATTAGWFFLLSIFAIRVQRMDAFNTVTSAAYIFLMFLSSLFYPLAGLPQWFQWTARINPMTWQVDMLRFSLLGAGAPAMVLAEAAAFVVFTLVCLALAIRALDRAA